MSRQHSPGRCEDVDSWPFIPAGHSVSSWKSPACCQSIYIMLVDQHLLRLKFLSTLITVSPYLSWHFLNAYVGKSHGYHESMYPIQHYSKDVGRLISLQFTLGRNLWTCGWNSESQFLWFVKYNEHVSFNLAVGFVRWRGFDIDEWFAIWSNCLCMDQCGWKSNLPSSFWKVCRSFGDRNCFFKSVGTN